MSLNLIVTISYLDTFTVKQNTLAMLNKYLMMESRQLMERNVLKVQVVYIPVISKQEYLLCSRHWRYGENRTRGRSLTSGN